MGWMGPVADGQEHEGWVVPLFADGAQGVGTSSARGLLVARQPDDGPCNGDRARLTYRDGSTAEGLWQAARFSAATERCIPTPAARLTWR